METFDPNPMRPRPRKPATTPASREGRVDVRVSIRSVLRAVSGHHEIYGWVRNLSPGGMYVCATESLPPDTECHVRLAWKDGPVFRAAFLKGWVVYANGGGVGVQFEAPTEEIREVLNGLDRRHLPSAAA
jgi:acylphosphatase